MSFADGLKELALDVKNEPQTLDAILTLRRKISDEQMRESLSVD